MSIRTRPKRRRGSIAARLFAAGTLMAALAGSVVQAGAAAADSSCPTFSAVGFTWDTKFNEGGVTLCHGFDGDHAAYLQIIDFAAGAKIRVGSEPTGTASSDKRDQHFVTRGVPSWFNWVAFGGTITDPSPTKLFSVMNAGFFVDLAATSRLSNPETVDYVIRSGGWALSQADNAWDTDKVKLVLGNPSPSATPPTQKVGICPFPTHYSYVPDVLLLNFCGSTQYKDAVVGFQPLAGILGNPEPPAAAARTMLGVDSEGKLFTVQFPSATLQETQAFLKSLGTVSEIQLDGGCSASYFAGARSTGFQGVDWNGVVDLGDCPSPVPEVLAVYTSTDAT